MIEFAKGHGTGNDFVIVDDHDGRAPLSITDIATLCDRRFGIGGDGLLRVVRTTAHPDGNGQTATWFMDYYNADGSIAEMCGNGVRVFARYLLEQGLVDGTAFTIATRAGQRSVAIIGDDIRVDMGSALVLGVSQARIAEHVYDGVHVSMGNPHLVCRVEDPKQIDLTRPPVIDELVFPNGVNVEFFSGDATHAVMRVHERGVGETLSCGTGACAVGAIALDGATGSCQVSVPGGELRITVTDDTLYLQGPANIVATGRFHTRSRMSAR